MKGQQKTPLFLLPLVRDNPPAFFEPPCRIGSLSACTSHICGVKWVYSDPIFSANERFSLEKVMEVYIKQEILKHFFTYYAHCEKSFFQNLLKTHCFSANMPLLLENNCGSSPLLKTQSRVYLKKVAFFEFLDSIFFHSFPACTPQKASPNRPSKRAEKSPRRGG